MDDILSRIAEDLVGRLDGPLKFRFLLQPMMAIVFAIRDGRKDALAGRDPYGWAVLSQKAHRGQLLHECWVAMKKVFILALVLDVIYQLIVFRWIYIGEALIVAPLLAFVPYILFRGPVSRLMRTKRGPGVTE
jgi:hypothetical protein